MAEVTQETLAILTLLLPQDSILQISRYKNREAELINQIAQQVLHASTQTALLIQEKERQAAEYEREGRTQFNSCDWLCFRCCQSIIPPLMPRVRLSNSHRSTQWRG